MRVLRADIDITHAGTDSDARNGHAFDQHEGIVLHHHAVRKGTRVTFVGIADDVFLTGLGPRHRFPFDTGRKGSASPPPQSGIQHLLDDAVTAHAN